MVGEGDELLAEPEHLDRVRLHAGERLGRTVREQPLRAHAEGPWGDVAEHLAGQLPSRLASAASSLMSMSTPITVPVGMPIPASGQPLQTVSSCSEVGRVPCLVQPR